MSTISMIFGFALIVVGLGGYALSGAASWTALIPAIFGLILVICGLLARNAALRKHVMHIAAVVAVLGVAGTASRALKLPALLSGAEFDRPAAIWASALTCLLCIVFLVLCIKSFIDARRKRLAGGAA